MLIISLLYWRRLLCKCSCLCCVLSVWLSAYVIKHVWASCSVPYVSLFKWNGNYIHMCMSRRALPMSQQAVATLAPVSGSCLSVCPCFRWQGAFLVSYHCNASALWHQSSGSAVHTETGSISLKKESAPEIKKKRTETERLFSHQTWEMLNARLQACMCEFAWLNVCALSCIIPPVFGYGCLQSSQLTVG